MNDTEVSGLASLFLHMESPRTPMHMASVAIFEGAPLLRPDGSVRVDDVRRQLLERSAHLPRLRQRPSPSLFGLVGRHWEDDPHFDISHHVRVAALPDPGDDHELLGLCGELLAAPLDMTRPLWELWLVEGLAHGRVAFVQKLHHALTDGLGGVELATALLDARRHPHGAGRFTVGPPDGAPGPASSGWRGAWSGAGRLVRAARHPARPWRRSVRLAEAFSTFASPWTVAPRSSMNDTVGLHRRLAVCRRPLQPLRELAHERGVSFNDVLLTGVAGGARALLASRGESLAGKGLQVLVPVGHGGRQVSTLGNDVSALVVRLPLDVEDPLELLGAVSDAASRRKDQHQDVAGDALVGLLDHLPAAAMNLVSEIVQHQPFVNVVVTDVPGPGAPLYCLGARMLEVLPFVPLAGNLSVGVAAFTYNGRLTVGLQADRDRCPDVDRFAAGIDTTFARLVRRSRLLHHAA